MVAPLLAIPAVISGLLEFVPTIAKWVAGDKAEKVAQTVVDVAKTVTGKATPEDALAALKSDPALVMQYQNAMFAHERALMEEETKRLAITSENYRKELESGDPYVRRMRPTWGYSMCFSFTTQMMAINYTIIVEPQYAAEIIASFESLVVIWGIGLSVLGIYINGRTKERLSAQGGSRTTPLGAGLLGFLRGGK